MAYQRYGELDGLNRLAGTIDDPMQRTRLERTSPGDNDYSDKWQQGRTKLKLLNVPWDTEYQHTVAWKDETTRNAWFDAHVGEIINLDTAWNYKSLEIYKPSLGKYEGTVDVPIPYETAMGYNYLYVIMYDQPVRTYGPTRDHFFYHITGINKLTANTVTLTLELDAWSEYITSATIESLDLARGHWPHVKAKAADWLKAPVDNTIKMDEPEPDLPNVQPRVAHEEYHPIYSDHPLAVIGTTFDPADPGSLWADGKVPDPIPGPDWWLDPANADPASDPYVDRRATTTRTYQPRPVSTDVTTVGRQDIHDNTGSDPRTPDTPVAPVDPTGQNPTNLVFSAMAPADWPRLYAELHDHYPQAYAGLKVLFVIPDTFAKLGKAYQFAGVSLQRLEPSPAWMKLGTMGLKPDVFGYPADARDYAKLYASQFASIEISDNRGTTTSVSVQDLKGDLDVYARASTVFPFLRFEAFVDGVGGHGIKDYQVRPYNPMDAEQPQGLWEGSRMTWDIPTYAIYAPSRTSAIGDYARRRLAYDRANKERQRAYASADVAWADAMNDARAANTSALNGADVIEQNGDASADLARDNAERSADTEKANTDASADTALRNADDSADTAHGNAGRSADTDRSNTDASADTALANADDSADTAAGNGHASNDTTYGNAQRSIGNQNTNGTKNINFTHDMTTAAIQHDKDMRDIELKYADQTYNKQSDWLNERNTTKHALATAGIVLGAGFDMLGEVVNTYVTNHSIANEQAKSADSSVPPAPQRSDTSLAPGEQISKSDGVHLAGTGPGDAVDVGEWLARMAAQAALANEQISLNFGYDHDAIGFAKSQMDDQVGETIDKNVTFNNGQNDHTRDNSTSTLANDVATASGNATDTHATTGGNIDRTQATTKGNAQRTHDTTTGNAAASNSTAHTNADKTHDMTTANIDKSWKLAKSVAAMNLDVAGVNATNNRDNALYDADQSYSLARESIQADVDATRAGAPLEVTEASGEGQEDQWGMSGIDLKVRTLNTADVEQVARTFRRWGYRMSPNTWVDRPNLDIAGDYTYWQARDVWITSHEMSETARMFLRHILIEGTTVWHDPDKVLQTGLQTEA